MHLSKIVIFCRACICLSTSAVQWYLKYLLFCQRDMYLILGFFPSLSKCPLVVFGLCSQAHAVTLGMSCAEPEVGLDDPGVSLPNQDLLWFCDSKPTPHSTGNENSDLISWPSLDRLPSGGEAGKLVFSSDSVASSSAQPNNQPVLNQEEICTPNFLHASKFMSPLMPCVDYKAMALPLPPRLQHYLHCSFKEILIIFENGLSSSNCS